MSDLTRRERLNAEANRYGVWDRERKFVLDYDAALYWRDRFIREGTAMRASGDLGKSDEQNIAEYSTGLLVLHKLMQEAERWEDLPAHQIIDFGCGVGYHLRWLRLAGARKLVGVDITDVQFAYLRSLVPEVRVFCADLTMERPVLPAAGIVMCLDVTQHVMTRKRVAHLLANARRALVPGGLFLCTTLDDDDQRSYYERGWPVATLHALLAPKGRLLTPRPYRDKVAFGVVVD